ncbi:MAG: SMC-Scp complex subunit ScpB [Methylococcaceae bacterium]
MTEPRLPDILEAALFAAGRPLKRDDFQALFPETERPDTPQLEQALAELALRYADRPCELREVASGYRLQVRECYSPWLSHLFEERPGRYSRALMETLAIIAYRQPVTRGEIEDIRGVAVSTQTVRTLQERAWIRIVGHKEVPGRPALLATTPQFLDHFNLKSLTDLPPLQDFITQLELEKQTPTPHVDQTPPPSTANDSPENPTDPNDRTASG